MNRTMGMLLFACAGLVGCGSSSDSSASSGSSTTGTSSSGSTSSGATSSGTSSSSGSSGTGGGTPNSCCGDATDCAVWKNVLVTWYGFNDNSCTVETQHDCNTIAFPGVGPKHHKVATEGKGTPDDPITCAASATNGGTGNNESAGGATLKPGTLVYNPEVRKYFVMEDQCEECMQDYLCEPDDDTSPNTKAPSGCMKGDYLHIDFWMGPSFMQNANSLNDCEDNSTIGNPYAGKGTVVVNPPSDLPVDSSPLYTGTGANGGCWTQHQVAPDTCP